MSPRRQTTVPIEAYNTNTTLFGANESEVLIPGMVQRTLPGVIDRPAREVRAIWRNIKVQ